MNKIMWVLIVVIFVVGVMAYNDVLPAPYSVEYRNCELNPDECVCEEENTWCRSMDIKIVGDKGYTKCYGKTIECKKYRKKSKQELEVDFCNENPNDGERCICEEEVFMKNPCTPISRVCTYYRTGNETSEELEKIKEDAGCYPKVCIKSRPKSPCELGDINFIEEAICVGKPAKIKHPDGRFVWYDKDYDKIDYEYGCEVDGKFISLGKIICREKTKVEKKCNKYLIKAQKCMDGDCREEWEELWYRCKEI